jgi:hypothetical protein
MLVAAVLIGGSSASKEGDKAWENLATIIEPLHRVVAAFDKISNKDELTPEVPELVDELVIVEQKYQRTEKDVNAGRSRSARSMGPSKSGKSGTTRSWWLRRADPARSGFIGFRQTPPSMCETGKISAPANSC